MATLPNTASKWMIYGVNGYTGCLCAEEAVRRGLVPTVAGRNAERVEAAARELGLPCAIFDLGGHTAITNALQGVDAVLNCAGPFSATAQPLLEACEAAGCHYLDVTGEIAVFEYVHQNSERWERADIAAIPGVGFDVVPTDCMAAMLHEALPGATRLRLAFKSRHGKMSPGTTKTIIESLPAGCVIRENGILARLPLGALSATIPFSDGPSFSVAISWGDVSTAYYSTGIPNIEVYTAVPEAQIGALQGLNRFLWLLRRGWVQRFVKRLVERRISGPGKAERDADRCELYGEVHDDAGNSASMTMTTPNGYSLTFDAAVTAVEKVLNGDIPPGALTPSSAFGSSFVLELDGVTCTGPE